MRIPDGWLPAAAAIVFLRRAVLLNAVGWLLRWLFVLDAVGFIGWRRSRRFLYAEPGRRLAIISGP